MLARGTVEEYGTSRAAFDDAEEPRQSVGSTGNTVYWSVDNPNEVTVRVGFPSADTAKSLSTSQGLRDAMRRAGIQGPPTIWLVDEA